MVESLGFLALLALSLYWFGGVRVVWVEGRSMEPALPAGSLLVAIRSPILRGDYSVGDIALIDAPSPKGRTLMIKRIAALAADSVAAYEPDMPPTSRLATTVPEGKVYVVGENADHSVDSRIFGALDRRFLRGKCLSPEEFAELPLVGPPAALSIVAATAYGVLRRRRGC